MLLRAMNVRFGAYTKHNSAVNTRTREIVLALQIAFRQPVRTRTRSPCCKWAGGRPRFKRVRKTMQNMRAPPTRVRSLQEIMSMLCTVYTVIAYVCL